MVLTTVNFSYLFPFEEDVGRNSHTDVLLNLGYLLEVRLNGFDHARRLIDLLALLHALIEIILLLFHFKILRRHAFRQMIHHFDDSLTLTLAQRVLAQEV